MFSEEDLTRYLQLSLDLFRDLQFSMQPRFHLEIGLLKMIQAGRLVPIEEALASLGGEPRPAAAPAEVPPVYGSRRIQPPSKPAAPVAPTPAVAAAPPSPDDDWREKLQSAMIKAGLQFSADAMSHASAALLNNELLITAPKQFQLDLGREEILTALKQIGYPTLRFKVAFGEVKTDAAAGSISQTAAKQATKPVAQDEMTERALGHPEVQRFRDLFGGEVRNVRNLKES
jgi:DNA polymerase-3 subunit gamma/tau